MRSEGELLSVIGQIYEAAGDPSGITQLCPLLAPHFGAASSIVHTCTQSSLEMRAIVSASKDFDAWAWSAYSDHYHDRNTWFQRGIRKGPSVVVICEELMPHRELLRSEWYDYCQKLGWFHCLGVGVSIADDLVGGMGFHRPRYAKVYGEEDRRKGYLILPHLERALQIQHRVAQLVRERELAFDLIDGLGIGVLVIAADGRLLFANRIAERMLSGGQGLSVCRARLRAQDLRQQQALERLIGEAARTSAGKGFCAGGVLSLPRAAGAPLTLLVAPFRSEAAGYGPALPAAVVILSDPDQPAGTSEKALRSAYQLTRAQARLLAAILRGQSLTEYAGAARISINTAKTLMSQVFHKTGASRQTDLVRTIAANPVFKLTQDR
jgi:DNA-binding CsgD family transcriptional regulator/PAS domain-containing protein